MVYEVYYIDNISNQSITIYVEMRDNSPIFYNDSAQVTIIPQTTLIVEEDRVNTGQIKNLINLHQIRATKRSLYAPTARFAQVEVDFGNGTWVNPSRDKSREEPDEITNIEGDIATATVIDSMVTPTSIFLCTVSHVATTDHDEEDAAIERITASVMNIKPGVGYDVVATAQNNSWGKYKVNVMIGG